MKKLLFFMLAICAVLLSGGGLSCQGGNAGPKESLVVAYSPFEPTGLLWIAQSRQYFSQNGLDVTLKKYDTGVASLIGVVNGEADIVIGVSEFPVVRMAFQKAELAILGSADKSEFIYLVGRKDGAIEKVADLKGKKVGVAQGTIAQFFLGRLLELNGLKIQDITLVDLKTPAEWVNAAANRDVDVVVTAQPDANTVKERLGANAIFWPVQSGQSLHGLIISSLDWTTGHPDLIQKFLKSMSQAEEYLAQNSAEAKTIVQKALNLDSGYIETVWKQNQFSLSLDQSLILAMEDEARWLISNNLTIERVMPNFLDYLYTIGLRAVKPDSVRISSK